MELSDSWAWAEENFGDCDLGDKRRTKRLVDYCARQAMHPEVTTNSLCGADLALREASYRLLENPQIAADDIAEGPFEKTAAACGDESLILAIQDTTMASFSHSATEYLGNIGGAKGSTNRGFVIHSTLAYAPKSQRIVGLLDQCRWIRPQKRVGRNKRKSVPYEKKETFKWEAAARRYGKRIEDSSKVISVCDREADIFEFLNYHVSDGHRFVVRACHNRCLQTEQKEHVWEYMKSRDVIGSYELALAQRGPMRGSKNHGKRPGRRASIAGMEVRASQITLIPSNPNKHRDPKPLKVYAIYVTQNQITQDEDKKPIEWMLLTSEPVHGLKDARRIIGYYENRWLIEEFHKAWKTGCRMEERRFQDAHTLERMLVILAFVAVRMLQLRASAALNPDIDACEILHEDELKLLAGLAKKRKRKTPKKKTAQWAMGEIASLVGWFKTKQNPRPGWQSLWKGWAKFTSMFDGYTLAKELQEM